MKMEALLSPTKLPLELIKKMTEVLTQMSQFLSAEMKDPRKSEEKQKEGASSDNIYCSIYQLLQ